MNVLVGKSFIKYSRTWSCCKEEQEGVEIGEDNRGVDGMRGDGVERRMRERWGSVGEGHEVEGGGVRGGGGGVRGGVKEDEKRWR